MSWKNIFSFDHLVPNDITCDAGEDGDDDIPLWISLVLLGISFFLYIGVIIRIIYIQKTDPVMKPLFIEMKNSYYSKLSQGWAGGCIWISHKYGTILCYLSIGFMFVMFLIMTLFLKVPPHYVWIVIISGCVLLFLHKYSYTGAIPDENEQERIKNETAKTYKPRNVYQDISASWTQVLFMFALQILLASIYVFSLIDDKFPPCLNKSSAWFLFLVAAITKSLYHGIEFSFEVELSWRQDRPLWIEAIIKANDNSKNWQVIWNAHGDTTCSKPLTKFDVTTRHFLDILINTGVDILIMCVMVIQAANGDWQDFVLNFIAAQFIMGLDNFSFWGYKPSYTLVLKEDLLNDSKLMSMTTKLTKEKGELELKIKMMEDITEEMVKKGIECNRMRDLINNLVEEKKRAENMCEELKNVIKLNEEKAELELKITMIEKMWEGENECTFKDDLRDVRSDLVNEMERLENKCDELKKKINDKHDTFIVHV